MKPVIAACLAGTILIVGSIAQEPLPRQGIAVEMPVANHAVEMPAADRQDAAIVAITANGRTFLGVEPSQPAALSRLSDRTVYLKADARSPYQVVLAVLDALRGKSIVLLSAPIETTPGPRYVPPYGTTLTVAR